MEVDQLDGKGHILWDLYFQAVLPTDIGTGTWSLRTQARANRYGTAPVDKPFQDLPRRLTTRPISNDLCWSFTQNRIRSWVTFAWCFMKEKFCRKQQVGHLRVWLRQARAILSGVKNRDNPAMIQQGGQTTNIQYLGAY